MDAFSILKIATEAEDVEKDDPSESENGMDQDMPAAATVVVTASSSHGSTKAGESKAAPQLDDARPITPKQIRRSAALPDVS